MLKDDEMTTDLKTLVRNHCVCLEAQSKMLAMVSKKSRCVSRLTNAIGSGATALSARNTSSERAARPAAAQRGAE